MRILLLGYGKMGKAIEQIATDRNHQIAFRSGKVNYNDLSHITTNQVDMAIEFTHPDAAFDNIRFCFENHIPVVSGTTGWLDRMDEIEKVCKQYNAAFVHSSNFSIGVNLFFELNKLAAKIMNKYSEYETSVFEAHHTEKADAPSGTAIVLANELLSHYPTKKEWTNQPSENREELEVISERRENVAGIHQVKYKSAADTITLTHEAHSRTGFAEGAVLAAEWLQGKTGIYSMKDVLGI